MNMHLPEMTQALWDEHEHVSSPPKIVIAHSPMHSAKQKLQQQALDHFLITISQ